MTKRFASIADIPHDDLYVQAYGKEYRRDPNFIRKMDEAITGTRDLGNVKADIREFVGFKNNNSSVSAPQSRGW